MAWNPFRRGTEKRAVSFQDFWGQGRDATLPVGIGMDSAVTLAAVYSATSLIADLVSSTPLRSYRKTQDGTLKEMDPPNPLVADPTDFGTVNDWIHRFVLSLSLRGNAYGLITAFDSLGYPRRIEWLHPDEVTVRIDRTVAQPQWYWLGRPIDIDLMVHIPYYTVPGRILGLAPIKAFGMAIETGLLAQEYGRDFFKHGSVPGGVLKTDRKVSEDEADVLKQRFKRAASGRETVVLGMGTEYQQISIAPEEAQFLQTMRYNATQVAAIYHLPPNMIGGDSGSPMTYSNIESLSTQIARFALVPYMSRLESSLFNYTPRPQYARFDLNAFERADMLTRYNAYHMAITDGWMMRDEVRNAENMSPLAKGLGGPNSVPPTAGKAPTGSSASSDMPGGTATKNTPNATTPKANGSAGNAAPSSGFNNGKVVAS